jgi:NADH dehydrogenase FAD-containing subunit
MPYIRSRNESVRSSRTFDTFLLYSNTTKEYGKTARREITYNDVGYTYYPVAIIGAGPSGIAMACRLKDVLGLDQFRIFDRQAGIGGTWWINRYPGVACDVLEFT